MRGISLPAITCTAILLNAGQALAVSATARTSQQAVESESPRDRDLTLADEPLVRIGEIDGDIEYIFGDVTGAVRLADRSVVVADEQSNNVRRFDANGQHMWSSGREGEGPGEYGGLPLENGATLGAGRRPGIAAFRDRGD